MHRIKKVYAIACVPVVLLALLFTSGQADATVPGGSAKVVCHDVGPATVDVTVSNTGWWWGIKSDMVLTQSDIPGIPAGTHVVMGHPVTVTLVASPATLHITATWPEVDDHEHSITITVPAPDCPAPPVCPDGTRPLDSTPPPLGCVPDTVPTTEPPTTAPPATPPAAPPAAPVHTDPVVTG